MMAESESTAGVITIYYVLLLITLLFALREGFEESESDFDPAPLRERLRKRQRKSTDRQMTLKISFILLVCLSKMFFPLVVRLENRLDVYEAISYEKSARADMYVHQKCPFRYWYD